VRIGLQFSSSVHSVPSGWRRCISRTSRWRFDSYHSSSEPTENPTAAYCLPELALIGVGMVSGAFAGALDWFYPLRLLAAVIALISVRKAARRASRADEAFMRLGLMCSLYVPLVLPQSQACGTSLLALPRLSR